MKSFLNYTSETLLELSNDEPEELNEISLRTAKPALALAFAFSKSKQVRQKLQNVKSTEDVSEKIDELSDALALTDSKMNAIYTMLLFISNKI